MGAIGRALEIRHDETRLVATMVALSFVAMAGLAAGQSGASALFLERIGADALPLMYLLQGATAFALLLALTGVLGRAEKRRVYLWTPLGLAALVFVERVALLTGSEWIYGVLWLTVALAFLVQNVFVWGVAGAVTDVRRAKRLFPLFAAGEILGSVVGGLVTVPLARVVGAENLLLAWGGALVVASVLCRVVLPAPSAVRRRRSRRPSASPIADLSEALRYVVRSRLLGWMTVAAILFSVLFYSLYLPWATAATERYPNADDLAGFFGLFWAAMTGAAFLVSVFATNRLFGRFGIASMAMVLPAMYAGSFAILLGTSAFAVLVAVRFVDGVWLQGVASPAWETLTNVVPESRRDQVRAFLNGGPAQAGTAIAGVIALIGQGALTSRQLAAVGLVTALLVLSVTWRIRRSYATALLEALRAGRPQIFPQTPVAGVPVALDRDAHALRSVLDAMNDERPSVRRLAVQLLTDLDDEGSRSSLEAALEDEDAGVRAEAVAAFSRLPESGPSNERLAALVGDPDPRIAASAAATIAARTGSPAAQDRLRALLSDEDPEVRATTVSRLRGATADIAGQLASATLQDEEPAVRAAALLTLASVDPAGALGPAIRLLADPSPRVRDAAAESTVMIGVPAVDGVLAALKQPAARDAAFRALARLDLTGRVAPLEGFAEQRRAEVGRDLTTAAELPPDGEATELLRDALLERARASGRSALQAMSLLTPDGAAMRAAIDNLDAREPAQVANALETLEATVDAGVVRPLLALWEPVAADRSAGSADRTRALLHDEDAFIVSCAEFVLLTRQEGDGMARGTTMPVMERLIFLRKVRLFEGLAPTDLHAIAGVAQDQTFEDGELLAAEGELGDALHVVVSGTVRVVREPNATEIARRGEGDVVGEMSLITRSPRIASLVAEGDVRAIRFGRREFESMVHDRPDIALGVMRVLAERLGERPDPA